MSLYDDIKNHISNEITTNQYVFLIGCEEGNIEILEWVQYCDNLDLTFESNLCFLLACENNNLEVVKYLYKKIPKIEFKSMDFIHRMFSFKHFELIKWIKTNMPFMFDFITALELYDIFDEIIQHDVDMAFWMLTAFPYIPIYLYDNRIFFNACNDNNIPVATLFAVIRPDSYYVSMIDSIIVQFEIISVLNIKKKKKTTPKTCYICYDKESNVVTSCNHQYCIGCLEKHYSVNNHLCPYCRKENWEKDLYIIEPFEKIIQKNFNP